MFRKLAFAGMVFVLCFTFSAVHAAEKDLEMRRKSTSKHAKCYKLVSGRSNEMCQLFEENLNRFCNEPPMVCERKIHPDFEKYFSFPRWEQVDPDKHMDVIADYIRARAPENAKCPKPAHFKMPKAGERVAPSPLSEEEIKANKAAADCQSLWREKKWEEYREGLLERMKLGYVKLFRAHFNINGYGEKEFLVYRLVDSICSPTDPSDLQRPRVPILIVFDEKAGKLDPKWTAILGDEHYDVIFYTGKPYLIAWGWGYGFDAALRIQGPRYIYCLYKHTGEKGAQE